MRIRAPVKKRSRGNEDVSYRCWQGARARSLQQRSTTSVWLGREFLLLGSDPEKAQYQCLCVCACTRTCTPFTRTFALQSFSRNCSPASDWCFESVSEAYLPKSPSSLEVYVSIQTRAPTCLFVVGMRRDEDPRREAPRPSSSSGSPRASQRSSLTSNSLQPPLSATLSATMGATLSATWVRGMDLHSKMLALFAALARPAGRRVRVSVRSPR